MNVSTGAVLRLEGDDVRWVEAYADRGAGRVELAGNPNAGRRAGRPGRPDHRSNQTSVAGGGRPKFAGYGTAMRSQRPLSDPLAVSVGGGMPPRSVARYPIGTLGRTAPFARWRAR